MLLRDATRDRWSLLTYKAQQHMVAQQEALAAWLRKVEQMQASQVRLSQMLQEYVQRQAHQDAQAHLVADALNHRQFMTQLRQLVDHATQQLQATQVQVAHARQSLMQAQMELDKAEKLEAHARTQERAQAVRREQRAMDDLAITRHQWRQV